MFKLRGKYSQSEIHQQVTDITELQAQREVSRNSGDEDEKNRADTLVEAAQLYLERMLEQ